MDPCAVLLTNWVTAHWEEAVRRVTHRCARGDVHRAEDGVQNALDRMWRNRHRRRHDQQGRSMPTYCERIHDRDGEVQIIIAASGQLILIPLTTYIVSAAYRNPPGGFLLLDDNGPAPVAPPVIQPSEELIECLRALPAMQRIAVIFDLTRKCPPLTGSLEHLITKEEIAQWQQRDPDTRRSDLFRGRKMLIACLWGRGGGDIDTLIDSF